MDYREQLKEVIHPGNLYYLDETSLFDMFEYEPEGNKRIFTIDFSRKTPVLNMNKILQYPFYSLQISEEIRAWIKHEGLEEKVNVFLSPISDGMIFAYNLARMFNESSGIHEEKRELKYRAVYSKINEKTGEPLRELQEGCSISSNDNVLILNDTTELGGGGLQNLIKLVERSFFMNWGGKVQGICVFADYINNNSRTMRSIRTKYPFHSIVQLNL